jgi:hypothetical protein
MDVSTKADFRLFLTPRARALLRRLNASSLVVSVRWVPGPCRDDWCTPVPKVEVRPGEPDPGEGGDRVVRDVEGVAVHMPTELAEAAARNADRLRIDAAPLRRRFRMSGLSYALKPPKHFHP